MSKQAADRYDERGTLSGTAQSSVGFRSAKTARSLEIGEAAAAKRYVRALKRLKATLASMPGGFGSD